MTHKNEKSSAPQRRVNPRKPLVRVGELVVGSQIFDCVIVDLSRAGAKIRTVRALRAQPAKAKLILKGIGEMAADVAWMRNNDIGLNFHTEMPVPEGHDNATIDEILNILPDFERET